MSGEEQGERMFIKEVHVDHADLEIELQTIASMYSFAPKIVGTELHGNTLKIKMEDLGEDTISNLYGDDPKDVPDEIWDAIRKIVEFLYEEEGIEYVDITPYNFIVKDDKLYVIDFGDAQYTSGNPNWFLLEFIDGENSWNPDYK